MHETNRLFLCARCGKQVLICTHCDRGQIYCADGCATLSRRQSRREARRRYESSPRGRLIHAERSRRYRLRHRSVTHQGSPAALDHGVLAACTTEVIAGVEGQLAAGDRAAGTLVAWSTPGTHAPKLSWRCHFCGRASGQWVRQGPLRRRCRARRR